MIVAFTKPVTLHWKYQCACKNKRVRNLFVNYSVRGCKKGNQQMKQIPLTLNMKKKSQPHKTELEKDDSKHTKVSPGAQETWS